MPTYLNSVAATAPQFQPAGKNVGVIRQVITMATGDLDVSDTWSIGYVPAGAKVLDVSLVITDMDSNGSPTLAFHVGDSGDTDRFISGAAATAASRINAGNSATAAANMAAHTAYTVPTLIYGTNSAAAATAVAGTIVATVLYSVEA